MKIKTKTTMNTINKIQSKRRVFKKTQQSSSSPPSFTLTKEYCDVVCSQSYLGKKGYTIPKQCLVKEDEETLKKELFLKPEKNCLIAGGQEDEAFPVYRENSSKIYIPRFYGVKRYGVPHRCEIECGENITVEFVKELRPVQCTIVDRYVNYVSQPDVSTTTTTITTHNIPVKHGGAILEVHTGAGKTVMALKIITVLKKKTLILVHKEFLMNQWIERIAEFIPDAKVGKIQGAVIDTENKDIVIGMIQSMYDKEFNADLFSQFGLTIIDEVHRIGSQQFSKTLFKTVTPYMLGISATVERKDGLTELINMFVGDKIYSSENKCEHHVFVRAIDYIPNERDTEFALSECDYRGTPQYSKMIVKLCDYGPRSDFIVRIVGDLVKEQPESQIMILAHNRSLLNYLSEAIIHRNIATCGFYLGGMKQKDLQETEKKQIVIATYAMAAEALDIKTLSTLMMVTPKTDVVQSVGRILRAKHANPIIVDLIDVHDLFQNQWRQRLCYYRKCDYDVRRIKSVNYKGMCVDWNNDNTWKLCHKPKMQMGDKREKQREHEGEDDKIVDVCNNKNAKINSKCLISVNELDFDAEFM